MSADYDLKHNIKVVPLITPESLDADNTPAALDTLGFRGVTICTHVGIGGITFSTTNKVEYKLTHSDDNVTYTAVEDDDVIMPYGETLGDGGIIRSLIAAKAAADAEVHAVGYRGKKRYLKLLADFSGTHGAATPMSAHAILSKPDNLPVGQTNFVPAYPDRTAQ